MFFNQWLQSPRLWTNEILTSSESRLRLQISQPVKRRQWCHWFAANFIEVLFVGWCQKWLWKTEERNPGLKKLAQEIQDAQIQKKTFHLIEHLHIVNRIYDCCFLIHHSCPLSSESRFDFSLSFRSSESHHGKSKDESSSISSKHRASNMKLVFSWWRLESEAICLPILLNVNPWWKEKWIPKADEEALFKVHRVKGFVDPT